jgi:hypothetical protein
MMGLATPNAAVQPPPCGQAGPSPRHVQPGGAHDTPHGPHRSHHPTTPIRTPNHHQRLHGCGVFTIWWWLGHPETGTGVGSHWPWRDLLPPGDLGAPNLVRGVRAGPAPVPPRVRQRGVEPVCGWETHVTGSVVAVRPPMPGPARPVDSGRRRVFFSFYFFVFSPFSFFSSFLFFPLV